MEWKGRERLLLLLGLLLLLLLLLLLWLLWMGILLFGDDELGLVVDVVAGSEELLRKEGGKLKLEEPEDVTCPSASWVTFFLLEEFKLLLLLLIFRLLLVSSLFWSSSILDSV